LLETRAELRQAMAWVRIAGIRCLPGWRLRNEVRQGFTLLELLVKGATVISSAARFK